LLAELVRIMEQYCSVKYMERVKTRKVGENDIGQGRWSLQIEVSALSLARYFTAGVWLQHLDWLFETD
jgi:hypothetical protein